jgi:hypothetical protein
MTKTCYGLLSVLSLLHQQAVGSPIIEMVGHSFKSPLTFENGLSSWIVSGASMALDKSVQILPPITRKHGYMFHVGEIETNHFLSTIEVDVAPVIEAAASELPNDQAFGIWYTTQNVSDTLSKFTAGNDKADWVPGLQAAGCGLQGVIPPSFKGLGVVFSSKGYVSVITSDGSRPASSFENLESSPHSIKDFNFRKPGVKVTLSFNKNRKSFSVYLSDNDGKRGQVVVTTELIPSKGYFGMTAYSGSSGKPDRYSVRSMRSINLDMKAGTGEDSKRSELGDLEAKLEKKNLHIDDLITNPEEGDDSHWFEDPENQIKDVHKAISIISEYLSDTRYRDQSLIRSMSDLQSRADALEELINELRVEMKYTFIEDGSGASLMHEVRGLKELIQAHSEDNKAISELKDKIKVMSTDGSQTSDEGDPELYQKLISASDELEAEVVSINFTANLAIGVFGLVVLVLGLLLYVKMRQYEKKHFL